MQTPIETAGRAVKFLLLGLAVFYVLDWAVFEVRRVRGAAMGSVAVDQYLQTPLKGSKAEYDYLGTANQACSRTLFPQFADSRWNTACWWLQRHREQWQ